MNNKDLYYGYQMPYPIPQNNYNTNQINDMNERINRLERQIKRLEQRITRLETPYKNEPDNNMYIM